LNLWGRLLLVLGFPVYVGHRRLQGWSGALPFYRCKCPEHGEYETYPQGFSESLPCPQCNFNNVAEEPSSTSNEATPISTFSQKDMKQKESESK